ncbi:MAG: hypothetical protein M1352_01575 [Patescibacteria group bacterium]|nr:hypothetical protein [Patescibacteria group bacterium]
MNIDWEITEEDINKVKTIVEEQKNRPFVLNRFKRNIEKIGINISEESLWKFLLQALLTTQEKSGPGSSVDNLSNERPFPLSMSEISTKDDKRAYILDVLKNHRLRYYNNKTDWIFHDYTILTQESIKALIKNLTSLIGNDSMQLERAAVHQIADKFKGIGPKQSRNFLQQQGLTKYVLPIDSRLTKWFNDNKLFPFAIDPSSLSSINFYEFIEDGVYRLCEQANIYPCILDACIFVSFNKGDY